MPDKPTSPFSGLDKALLRSTQALPIAPEAEGQEAPRAASPAARSRSAGRPALQNESELASQLASVPASTLASYDSETVDAIRKAVRAPGREVSFVRLAAEEKAEVADIVYAYKRQGHRTSENEINRIAINFILRDYKANKANSILSRVLAALLS